MILRVILLFFVYSLVQGSDTWYNSISWSCSLTTGLCSGSRSRLCGNAVCASGVVTEVLTNCPSSNVCSGTNLVLEVEEACLQSSTDCNAPAIDTVRYTCPKSPGCLVTHRRYCVPTTCIQGTWTPWSDTSGCNATCSGFKTRQRECRDTSTNQLSKLCEGSARETTQTDTALCTPPCPTGTGGRSGGSGCQATCSANPTDMTSSILFEKCTAREECPPPYEYITSCAGYVSDRTCTLGGDYSYCSGTYLPWQEWESWTDLPNNRERRRHFKWCDTPVAVNPSPGRPCWRTVWIETECRDKVQATPESRIVPGPEPETTTDATDVTTNGAVPGLPPPKSQSGGLPVWVIILIILLIILAVVIIICCCRRRKKRKKVKKTEPAFPPPPTPIEMDEMQSFQGPKEDSVFVATTEKPAASPNRLNVMQRFAKASEHVYERIAAKRERIFSRNSFPDSASPSAANSTHGTPYLAPRGADEKSSNEYVLTELEKKKKKSPKGILRPGVNGNQPLRISVTVTNPEGQQVENSAYKSQLSVEDNMSDIDRKQRWSRVPTPRVSSPGNRFFSNTNQGADKVQSVKYGTPSDEPVTLLRPTPDKKEKTGFKKMLLKLKTSPKDKSLHSYDSVPHEPRGASSKPRVYIPSATASIEGMEDDDVSMWSDSTFDDLDSDDFASPTCEESLTARKTARRTRNRQKYKSRSMATLNTDINDQLPRHPHSATPVIMHPNSDVRSARSDTSVAEEKFSFPDNSNCLAVKPQGHQEGYLDMSIHANGNVDPLNRKDVKSWVNLGAPPLPQKPKSPYQKVNKRKNSPGFEPQSSKSPQRELDLDEKYVTSISIDVPSVRHYMGDGLETDRHGYLHLGFPEHNV
ncbi:uncharacterized protein LOC100185917 [Ciona intestinalis]